MDILSVIPDSTDIESVVERRVDGAKIYKRLMPCDKAILVLMVDGWNITDISRLLRMSKNRIMRMRVRIKGVMNDWS